MSTQTTAELPSASDNTRGRIRLPRLQELGLLVVIFVIGTALAMLADPVRGENGFLRPANLLPSVLTTMSWTAVMAVGVTVVIITGGIDISVGSIMGLSALACAFYLQKLPADAGSFKSLLIGISVPVCVGGACGLINGALVVGLRMHPFIVTLGTMSIFRGIALVSVREGSLPYGDRVLPAAFTDHFIAYTRELSRASAVPWLIVWLPWFVLGMWMIWFAYRFASTRSKPIGLLVLFAISMLVRYYLKRYVFSQSDRPAEFLQPIPLILMLCVLAAGWIYLQFMVWGRETYAVGGNEEASRFSGVSVGRVKLRAYVISGLCAGIAGMISCGFYKSAATNTGLGYELMVIASAVVGGASLSGGRGTALGAVLGTLIIQLIDNGISLLSIVNLGFATVSVSKEYTQIIVGIAIIVAVAVDRLSEFWQKRRLAGAMRK